MTGGQIPPHAPVEVDGHDPIHPDDHGPPVHDDVEFPNEDVDDSGEQDDDYGMNDPPTGPPSGGQPPTFPPYPPPSNPPVVNVPVQSQPQFDNPDETIEQVMQPVADEDSSSEDRTLTEPIRLQMKQRHVSHDSDDKPPKAQAKIQMKKQKVQLPGHQQAIVPPTVKPPAFEDEESNPTASSSNDTSVPLPTTTPHSFTPSPAVPEDTADYDTPQSGSRDNSVS